MSKISGQLLISGQFQDSCEISEISGQLGALYLTMVSFWIAAAAKLHYLIQPPKS